MIPALITTGIGVGSSPLFIMTGGLTAGNRQAAAHLYSGIAAEPECALPVANGSVAAADQKREADR